MKKILFTTALFLIFQCAFSQTDSAVLKNAVSKIRTEITDHIIEKAYLQFDRPNPYYLAGDAMYFKAYVTMGERHEPTKISGVLHVDLIGNNNTLIQTQTLQLINGTAWGDFALPDSLQKGTYRVRAYTQWMRNREHPDYFEQYISVSSLNGSARTADAAKATGRPSVQFFPEGGSLVTDFPCKIAFKAIGADGTGVNVKGIVIDNDNKEVLKLPASHLGMGAFTLTPEAGRTYKAKLTYADGSSATVNLPAIDTKTISLAVNTDDPSKVSVEIRASRAYYKENQNKDLNLLIYWAGAVRTVKTKFDNSILGLDLPAANFRTGILQVTLFSQTGEPLSERLVFIQNKDLLNLDVKTNKASYTTRGNVQVNLTAKNKDGAPVNGSFSAAVVDDSRMPVDENAEITILTSLLLTSDVKGYIESPNYYFTNVSSQTRADLDVLMLTQGFRRFVWKDLLNNTTIANSAAYKPEVTLAISGTIKTKAGVPAPDVKFTIVPQDGGDVLTGETDEQGKFSFEKMLFTNNARFILKTQGVKSPLAITLDRPAAGPPIIPGNTAEERYNTGADVLSSLQLNANAGVITASSGSVKQQLGGRTVATGAKDNYRSSALGGPGHADQVINGDDIKTAPNLSTGLNGLARGVDFYNGVPYLKTNTVISMGATVTEPMLLSIDGTLATGSVDRVNPGAVETIEILKGNNAAIYGMAGGAGVIVITTREGGQINTDSKEMSPGVYSFNAPGFYKAKEFYAPQYDVAKAAGKPADKRTATVFWRPDVITDANGNASFNYSNSDGTGNYTIIIEGMDTNGNIGRQIYKYKVQ